jgi:hypothetical protein
MYFQAAREQLGNVVGTLSAESSVAANQFTGQRSASAKASRQVLRVRS